MVKNPPAKQEMWVQFLGQEDPMDLETHCTILAWRIRWKEEPGESYGPCGCKELDTT